MIIFVKLFSVVSEMLQCGWTFQGDFQCYILIVTGEKESNDITFII